MVLLFGDRCLPAAVCRYPKHAAKASLNWIKVKLLSFRSCFTGHFPFLFPVLRKHSFALTTIEHSMKLFNKIKWVLGLSLVFILILATNLIDRDNFRKVRNSIVTIYEDRIVANDLLFEYLQLIHEKELAVASSNNTFFATRNQEVQREIASLTEKYRTTKLTNKEASVFESLQNDLAELEKMEAASEVNSEAYRTRLSATQEKLSELSKIQLKEGKNQMTLSKEAVADVELFTQLEIYFLFFLAIIVQIIVLYNPKRDTAA
jgi:hypothetical protein